MLAWWRSVLFNQQYCAEAENHHVFVFHSGRRASIEGRKKAYLFDDYVCFLNLLSL